jgi:hypothetical protein
MTLTKKLTKKTRLLAEIAPSGLPAGKVSDSFRSSRVMRRFVRLEMPKHLEERSVTYGYWKFKYYDVNAGFP